MRLSIKKLRQRLGRRRRLLSALVPAEPQPEPEPEPEPESQPEPEQILPQDIKNSLRDFEKYLVPKSGHKDNDIAKRSVQAAIQFLSWLANPALSIGKAVMFGKIVIVILYYTILIAY